MMLPVGFFFYPWTSSNGSEGRALESYPFSSSFSCVHWIGNLNVLSFVAKLLNDTVWVEPLPLHKDGDQIGYIQGM